MNPFGVTLLSKAAPHEAGSPCEQPVKSEIVPAVSLAATPVVQIARPAHFAAVPTTPIPIPAPRVAPMSGPLPLPVIVGSFGPGAFAGSATRKAPIIAKAKTTGAMFPLGSFRFTGLNRSGFPRRQALYKRDAKRTGATKSVLLLA